MGLAKFTQGENQIQHGFTGPAIHAVSPTRLAEQNGLSGLESRRRENIIQRSLLIGWVLQSNHDLLSFQERITNQVEDGSRSFIVAMRFPNQHPAQRLIGPDLICSGQRSASLCASQCAACISCVLPWS